MATSLYGYDGAGRLTSITHKNASGTKIDDFNYIYDAAGRITAIASTRTGTDNDTYDKTNQLFSNGVSTYAWDANGNPKGSSYTHRQRQARNPHMNAAIVPGCWSRSSGRGQLAAGSGRACG